MRTFFASKAIASSNRFVCSISRRFYGGDVNIWSKERDFEFVNRFMKSDEDPVKDKWPILRRYRAECRVDPMVDERRFEWIYQRYGK